MKYQARVVPTTVIQLVDISTKIDKKTAYIWFRGPACMLQNKLVCMSIKDEILFLHEATTNLVHPHHI